VTKFSFPT